MRRTGGMVVMACAALAAGAAGCGSDDDDAVKVEKKTFTVDEREGEDSFAFVDAPPRTKVGEEGPEALSGGDVLTFQSDLLRNGKVVGSLLAHCTVVKADNETFDKADLDCEGTYALPEGTMFIKVGGKDVFGADSTDGAVTGGLGDYKGATGTFTSPNEEEGDTRSTFTISVPKD